VGGARSNVRSSNEILKSWKIDHERRISYQPKPWNQSTWTIPQEIYLLKDSYINHDILSSHSLSSYSHFTSRSTLALQVCIRFTSPVSTSGDQSTAFEVQPSNSKSQYIYIYVFNQILSISYISRTLQRLFSRISFLFQLLFKLSASRLILNNLI